jgi:hypothetical protein
MVFDEVPNAGGGYMAVPLSCMAPTGVTVTNITDVAATVSWTAVSGATGYEVSVSPSSTPPASGFALTGTSVNVSQLSANNNYYAHVRTRCGASFSPTWESKTFSTKPTSVNDLPQAFAGLKIYPNPGDGHFNIELPENISEAEIMVFDMTGRIADRKTCSGNSKTIFDLSDQPKGIYLLQVQSAGNVYRARLMIQ